MKEYLLSLANYNFWANRKIEDFVRTAGEEKCILEQQSSFTSVKATVLHIWDAQSIWLDRLHSLPVENWPGKNFNGTALEAATGLVENSQVWIDLVYSLDEKKLNDRLYYTNIKGVEFSSLWSHIIAHVMNHGTYHRGQLITMLRGAGFTDVASTDLISFYREEEGQ